MYYHHGLTGNRQYTTQVPSLIISIFLMKLDYHMIPSYILYGTDIIGIVMHLEP